MNINGKMLNEIKTIDISYDKLQRDIDSIIEKSGNETKLVFSIFETISDLDDNWKVKIPDIHSKEPVLKGTCLFSGNGTAFAFGKENPTWYDIILVANSFANDQL